MHLINRKVAGDEIPASLPPSLVPPSMRSKGSHSSSPPSPKQLANFKSPPPPPPKRLPSRVNRSHSLLRINSTTPDHIPHLNVPTTSLPQSLIIKSPKVQSSFPTPPLSPSNYPEADLTSPFEDPVNGTSPSRRHSLLASKPVPSNHSNNESLEVLRKETSRLTLQVSSLLSQLTAQNNLQDVNESLRKERDSLKVEMLEMERTVSEVLSANDQNGSEEQYIQEINRLSTELASKEVEHETTQRMLAVLTEEDTDLRRQLRESQAASAKARNEIEDLLQNVASREGDITELRARLSDMGKEMAEGPESTSSNNRELRVLLRDVTRENDSLKGQVRNMQKSMEQLLLSTKSHAKFDEVERENRRLQAHVQELEMLATQLQSTPNNSTQQRHNQVLDEAARKIEQLEVQLQTGHRVFIEFRTSRETMIDELQQKLATMEHENNQLKMEASSSERGQADNSIPPPAYNDSFSTT
jgi:epidermal growth factor receptor substrate 15